MLRFWFFVIVFVVGWFVNAPYLERGGRELAQAQQVIVVPSCYNLTTSAVSMTYTSCGAPTSSPTITPTATPTPNGGVFGGFTNGQPFPAGWAPFSPSPVWASPLPTITPGYYDANSSTIIAAQWAQGATSMGQSLYDNEPGNYDTSIPIYVSATSDPVINLISPILGNQIGQTGGVPQTIYIPNKARPTQSIGLASNIAVFQPSGQEVDLSVASNASPATLNPPTYQGWKAGQTMNIATTGNLCSNFYTGNGVGVGTYPVSNVCGAAGLVGIADFQRGEIDHALALWVNCTAAGGEYPANNANSAQICTDGVGPLLGATYWYDVPCATTTATAAPLYERAWLCALNKYGGIVVGVLGGGKIGQGAGTNSGQFGFTFGLESSEPFYAYGNGDQWAIMFNQGWVGSSVPGYASGYQRWRAQPQDLNGNYITNIGVNFASHMHVLKPCVKQQSC